MQEEDDIYVVEGLKPPKPALLSLSIAQIIYKNLQENLNNNNPALVDGLTGREVTYKHLLGLSCTLAKTLVQGGCGKGTMMAISSENNLEFFIPVLSALYIGATMCPISHKFNQNELIHCLNITKPTVVFCSKSVSGKFTQLKKQLKFIERIVVIDGNGDENGAETLGDLIATEDLIYEFKLAEVESMDDVIFVLLSSGTTGLPKGVMLTQKNIAITYISIFLDEKNLPDYATGIGLLPFYHTYGLLTTLSSIGLSQKIIVLSRFEVESFLECVSKYKISRMWLVPPILHAMLHSPLLDKYDLSSLKRIVSGGAVLSTETLQNLQERLKGSTQIHQAYGLTEATVRTLKANFDKYNESKSGSVGFVPNYMKVKVRDLKSGESLGPNQMGELCVKGPMVMKGYFGNAEATRNAFTSDGWLLTGDLVYYDEDKYFYIVDRLKELIKYKGFQVAPAEIEGILMKHPEICDAAVVGLPRADVGELPTAFVVKTQKSQLDEKGVKDFVAELVTTHKKIRGGVIFLDTIPKSPSGKILRRQLRDSLVKNKRFTALSPTSQ